MIHWGGAVHRVIIQRSIVQDRRGRHFVRCSCHRDQTNVDRGPTRPIWWALEIWSLRPRADVNQPSSCIGQWNVGPYILSPFFFSDFLMWGVRCVYYKLICGCNFFFVNHKCYYLIDLQIAPIIQNPITRHATDTNHAKSATLVAYVRVYQLSNQLRSVGMLEHLQQLLQI